MAVISTQQALRAWAAKVGTPANVYLDIETTGLTPGKDVLVSIQLLIGNTVTILDCRSQLKLGNWQDTLSEVLANASVLGHNLHFDLRWLAELGVKPQYAFDTMLAEQVLEGVGLSDARLQGVGLSLKALAEKYAKVPMSKEERSWFIDLDKRTEEWAAPFPEAQLGYMEADVRVLPAIAKAQRKALKAHGLEEVASLEMHVLPALVAMETKGIRVNVAGWRSFIAQKQAEADTLEAEAMADFALPILEARLAKYDTELAAWQAKKAKGEKGLTRPKQDSSLPNLNSQQQLLDAFHSWGIPLESTSSMALADVDDERVGKLVAYRKAIKFVQTFGESLLEKADALERIHPEYVQIGASTGRMSCRNPNWQQVPSKGDGQQLRELVVPDSGNMLVVADFSNIELRILAAASHDKTLLAAFEAGLDLHSELAYTVFKLARDVDVATAEYTKGWTYRSLMKTITYGLVYGMSATRLSRLMRVERKEAQAIMDDYFKELGAVKKWLKLTGDYGAANGEAHTKLGRVRKLEKADAKDGAALARVRRQAANTPIQGTSADITKKAVAYFHEAIRGKYEDMQGKEEVWLVAVVHDELVAECTKRLEKWVVKTLADCMNRAQREVLPHMKGLALPRPVPVPSGHWTH